MHYYYTLIFTLIINKHNTFLNLSDSRRRERKEQYRGDPFYRETDGLAVHITRNFYHPTYFVLPFVLWVSCSLNMTPESLA